MLGMQLFRGGTTIIVRHNLCHIGCQADSLSSPSMLVVYKGQQSLQATVLTRPSCQVVPPGMVMPPLSSTL